MGRCGEIYGEMWGDTPASPHLDLRAQVRQRAGGRHAVHGVALGRAAAPRRAKADGRAAVVGCRRPNLQSAATSPQSRAISPCVGGAPTTTRGLQRSRCTAARRRCTLRVRRRRLHETWGDMGRYGKIGAQFVRRRRLHGAGRLPPCPRAARQRARVLAAFGVVARELGVADTPRLPDTPPDAPLPRHASDALPPLQPAAAGPLSLLTRARAVQVADQVKLSRRRASPASSLADSLHGPVSLHRSMPRQTARRRSSGRRAR